MNDNRRLIRVLGVLALVGGITAIFLIIAFENNGWGPPGTTVYKAYQMLNRRMAGALFLMTAGWLGMVLWLPKGYGQRAMVVAFVCSLLMVVGVAAEFWLYSDLPYAKANMRTVAFSLYSLSGLAFDVSLTVAGISLWRSRLWPRWSIFILLLALPLDLVAFIWLDSIFLASTILTLVAGVNLSFTKQFPAQVRTNVP